MQCELMYYAILFIMKSLNKLIQESNNINYKSNSLTFSKQPIQFANNY